MKEKVIFPVVILTVLLVILFEYLVLKIAIPAVHALQTELKQSAVVNPFLPLQQRNLAKLVNSSWSTQSLNRFYMHSNCTLLFKADKKEIGRARATKKLARLSDSEFYHKASDCSWLTKEFDRQYFVSEFELQFPLAFALNVYNAPQQIFRFLKVIYRKHNVYCLHYDQKSDPQFKQLMIQMANCLPNVIVPSVIENVIRGWHTIVDAQMNCFDELLKVRTSYPWRYVITLCGKEIPLRTNREMVQALSKLNGTSAIRPSTVNTPRFKFRHILKNGAVVRTKEVIGLIPFNFTIHKSIAYVGLTEAFVDYLLHNKTAVTFRKFMDQTKIPEEHFVATLFTAPGVPGGYDAKYASLVPIIEDCIWLVRMTKEESAKHCSGRKVHSICILNSGDLHRLHYKPEPRVRERFFHNKFFMEENPTVMDCLEEELIQRNTKESEYDHA